jgi:hypothetical protein
MTTQSRATITNDGLISRLADAAAIRFYVAVPGTDARHVKYSSSAADIPTGVFADGADAAEDDVAIALFGKGESKVVKMSGAGSKDDYVCSTADGSGKARVLPTVAGTYYIFGKLLNDALDGEEAAIADFVPRAVVVQATIADASATDTAPVALTYAAPAGGATQDAEARASLAQSAADVAAIRTRQGTVITELVALKTKINAILVALETASVVKASLWVLLIALFAVAIGVRAAYGSGADSSRTVPVCMTETQPLADLPLGSALAVLPLACVPRLRGRNKHNNGLRHLYLPATRLSRRYGGISVCAANEDQPAGAEPPAAVAAGNAGLKILDASGRELPVASRDGSTIRLGNASAALGGMQHQQLSTFAVGYPTDQVDAIAQFLAPYVEAPVLFSYAKNGKANAYLATEDDAIGIGGLPAVILPDAKTIAEARLQWRGLETQMSDYERQIAGAIPGGSVQMEEEERIQLLVDATRRGRLLRAITLAAAAAGGATAKTWNDAANPIKDLRGYIDTVAQEVGGPQNVRLLFGSSAWNIMIDQAKLAGGANMPYQIVDKARVAQILGIPAANIEVSYLQVVSSKQGKTTTTAALLTAAEIYIFGCTATPTRRDASFMKTFAMKQGAGWYGVYTYQKHPLVTGYGLNYYELPAVTNATAVARLSIS